MGKAGRFACIFLPMVLTVGALLCLLLVFLGGTNDMAALRSLYLFKADTSEYTSNPIQIDGTEIDDEFFAAFDTAENLQDFYSVYLWNHCSGDSVDGRDDVKQCSGRTAGYAFDPIEVWGIDRAAIDEHFPEQLDRGLRIYRQVVRWMFAAYAIAFCATAAEIAVGIFAVCSRWGSFATTIVATAAFIVTLAASLISTILSATLVGAINTTLKPVKISASLGRPFLSVTWLAVAFSLGALAFWLFSTCCVSGRSNSPSNSKRRTQAEKTPYTYERVGGVGASPYLGGGPAAPGGHQSGQAVPLRDMSRHAPGGAYEPYRQV